MSYRAAEATMRPGTIIKLLRQSQGLSQRELAERAGVARTYLAQVESGRREAGLVLLRALGRELQVPVALLLIDDQDQGPESEIRRELRGVLEHVLKAKAKTKADDHRQDP